MARIIVVSAAEFGRAATEMIIYHFLTHRRPVVCWPSGSTPREVYAVLIEETRRGTISFVNVESFALDEWGEVSDVRLSCAYDLRSRVFDRVGVPERQVHVWPPRATPEDCIAYESLIADCGGLTLGVLGIGLNGHVGLNEPGSDVDSRTRIVTLTPLTQRLARKNYGFPHPPAYGVTVGLATLMESRELLLLAQGSTKAPIIRRLLQEAPSEALPASLLLDHPHLTIMIDSDAAQGILRIPIWHQSSQTQEGNVT
ncbi:MAG: glucosamine-6-phosphate deaminase [Firmicutes bacterium]|nr:glucosamine-6-phosphate deaminase [Bacillota bacterium]